MVVICRMRQRPEHSAATWSMARAHVPILLCGPTASMCTSWRKLDVRMIECLAGTHLAFTVSFAVCRRYFEPDATGSASLLRTTCHRRTSVPCFPWTRQEHA